VGERVTTTDPTFSTRAQLEQWAVLTAKQAAAHQALGERTATLEALALIKRVTLAHLHLPFADQQEPTPTNERNM